MTSEDWNRSPLPRVEDLPVAEQGYERAAVQQAFDAFYRHVAQLDSTLQTLDAVDAFQRQAGELRAELRTLRSAGWTLQPWRPGVTRDATVRTGIPPALPRVLAELVLLIVLAVFVGVGHFAPWVVIVVMASGALLVAIVEVFASRERLPARAVAVARQEQLAEQEPAPEPAPTPLVPVLEEQTQEPEPAFGWSAFGGSADAEAEPLGLAAVPRADEAEAREDREVDAEPEGPAAEQEEPVLHELAEDERPEPLPDPVEEPLPAAAELVTDGSEPIDEQVEEPPPPAAEQAVDGSDRAEGDSDSPTEEPLAALEASAVEASAVEAPAVEAPGVDPSPESAPRHSWFGRSRDDEVSHAEDAGPLAATPAPGGAAPEAEPEPEPQPEPEQIAASGDEPAEEPESAAEPAPAAEGWPDPVGWPDADAEVEPRESAAEPDAALADAPRRRWFGRRHADEEPPEPESLGLEPPRHVRVLPPSESTEDPWERGFDETMEPLGHVDAEDADEPSEDTEDGLSSRGLRRRRR